MQAKTTFKSKLWDEKPYSELPNGSKYTRTHSANTFTGDLVGETTVEYITYYREDGTGTFVGFEHFTGRLGDREGMFTLQHVGEWTGKVVQAKWTIVPGSGTGGLKGINGSAYFEAGHLPEYPMVIDYELE